MSPPSPGGPTDPESLLRDYRVALLRYLPRRDETALAGGYDLGRSAIERGVGALELVQVHHRALAGVVAQVAAEAPAGATPDLGDLVTAGGEFLLEVLSSVEMSHPGLRRAGRPRGTGPGPDAAGPRA